MQTEKQILQRKYVYNEHMLGNCFGKLNPKVKNNYE